MILQLRGGLPYVSATVEYQDREVVLESVLVDTGSGGTLVSADKVAEIGLIYEPHDAVHRICGVGGAEFVFAKQAQQLSVGSLVLESFTIEVGELDYGFELDGILGMDFLTRVGAVIDLSKMKLTR